MPDALCMCVPPPPPPPQQQQAPAAAGHVPNLLLSQLRMACTPWRSLLLIAPADRRLLDVRAKLDWLFIDLLSCCASRRKGACLAAMRRCSVQVTPKNFFRNIQSRAGNGTLCHSAAVHGTLCCCYGINKFTCASSDKFGLLATARHSSPSM